MANNLKGMKKAEIAAQSLARRNELLLLLERNGKLNIDYLVTKVGFTKSTLNQWLASLVESGHVRRTTEMSGRRINWYERGSNKAPLTEFCNGISHNSTYIPQRDPVVRQKTVKAKQIGMVRDELVAFLFGEAVQA